MKKWERDLPEAWNTKKNKDFKKGAVLKGKYTGVKKEIQGARGTSWIYNIDVGDGEITSVWGTKKLDDFFQAMPAGIKVEVTYQGKQTLEGGNTFHNFDLVYDEVYYEKNKTDPDDVSVEDVEKIMTG